MSVDTYGKIKGYISADDFTEELYKQVADKLFADLNEGNYNPAAIISTSLSVFLVLPARI